MTDAAVRALKDRIRKQEEKEMKSRSHKILIPALVITVALIALSLATGPRVRAQAGTQQFKVGDRV